MTTKDDTQETVEVCPKCDRAGQGSPNQRSDGTWKCYKCGAEFSDPREREDRRGNNLTIELCRRGGNNAPVRPAEYYRKIAANGGRPPDSTDGGERPKYADLELEDVGLEPLRGTDD